MAEQIGVKQFGRVVRIPTATGFGVGDINSYVILPEKNSRQLVLIDTGIGSEEAWQTLAAGLNDFGFGIEDITLLLLTHGHTDHYGQAGRIRKVSGCQVWAHEAINMTLGRYVPSAEREAEERYFLGTLGFTPEDYDRAYSYRDYIQKLMTPCEFDHLLCDGETVPIEGFELKAVHTPGHCPEELIFWQEQTRQMFSGDHLLPEITPVCLLDIPESSGIKRTRTLIQYYQSTDKIKPYAATSIYPSHGDVFHDHLELIASYRLSTERRLLKISRILSEHGAMLPLEVGKKLFPKVWQDQLYPVISEIMGHLDMLEEGGHVACEEQEGRLYYTLTSVPEPV